MYLGRVSCSWPRRQQQSKKWWRGGRVATGLAALKAAAELDACISREQLQKAELSCRGLEAQLEAGHQREDERKHVAEGWNAKCTATLQPISWTPCR